MPSAPPPKKAISFCTTCRNRLWQIQQTLEANLSVLQDDLELVLVDYGSTDGLSDWVWSRFEPAIRAGRLVFFEVRNKVAWSSPRAKNLSHRMARGDYLFNLDADNFITPADVRMVRQVRAMGLACQQFTGVQEDGSFGRIGIPAKLFFELGGYDETLLPMGGQDTDLVNRLRTAKFKVATLAPPGRTAVKNDYAHKIAEVGSPEVVGDKNPQRIWEFMDQVNFRHSLFRLQYEGPWRTDGFQTFRGLLNGRPVVIDGFNQLRSDAG